MASKKPGNNAIATKSSLRKAATARRGSTTPESGQICRLLESFLADVHGFVVVYDALAGEVNLGPLWDGPSSTSNEISWAITRTPARSMDLTCHAVSVKLERHRWGYRQPVAGAPQIADEQIAVVLVPGLAFDLRGGRIGWGAGYYDRFLARLGPNTLRIGVSDGYMVDEVPMDAHDVAMTHVVTAESLLPTCVV